MMSLLAIVRQGVGQLSADYTSSTRAARHQWAALSQPGDTAPETRQTVNAEVGQTGCEMASDM
jgi:hypothetical protein